MRSRDRGLGLPHCANRRNYAGCASIGRVRKHRKGAQASAGCASIGWAGSLPAGRFRVLRPHGHCAGRRSAQHAASGDCIHASRQRGPLSATAKRGRKRKSASPQEQAQVRQAHTADGTQHPRTTTHPRDLGLRGGCVVWTPDRAKRPHRAARGRASRRR